MYPKFIEIHDWSGNTAQVNVAHIVAILENQITLDTESIKVKESYMELSKLITDAGCNITRKDPRVDPEPLTMEDLKEMLGQPVWDVSKQQWLLVRRYIGSDGGVDMAFLLDADENGYSVTAEDLIHHPLYRMKVKE